MTRIEELKNQLSPIVESAAAFYALKSISKEQLVEFVVEDCAMLSDYDMSYTLTIVEEYAALYAEEYDKWLLNRFTCNFLCI